MEPPNFANFVSPLELIDAESVTTGTWLEPAVGGFGEETRPDETEEQSKLEAETAAPADLSYASSKVIAANVLYLVSESKGSKVSYDRKRKIMQELEDPKYANVVSELVSAVADASDSLSDFLKNDPDPLSHELYSAMYEQRPATKRSTKRTPKSEPKPQKKASKSKKKASKSKTVVTDVQELEDEKLERALLSNSNSSSEHLFPAVYEQLMMMESSTASCSNYETSQL